MTTKLAELYCKHGHSDIKDIHGKVYVCLDDSLGLAALMAEINKDSLEDRKVLIKKALCDFPDTSADAIADYYNSSKELARSLCRGMGRRTVKSHLGNDYELRGRK